MMTDSELNASTGGQLNGVPLQDVPGVSGAYAELLNRVRELDFVPAGWIDTVRSSMGDGRSIWSPRYAIRADAWAQGKSEPLLGDVPTWLTNNPEAAVAWNKLADWWKAKLQPILSGWARDQAELLASANADAAFWNGLYSVVKPAAVVGEMIIAAPEAVGNVVSRSVLGALRGFAPVLIIAAVVGGGFLLYKSGSYKKLLPK